MGGKAVNPTPGRNIRVPDERWERFGELVGERGRGEVINAFIAWMNREPGAKQPKRPPVADEAAPAE